MNDSTASVVQMLAYFSMWVLNIESLNFCVTVQIDGVDLHMELDTGAAVSVISEATFKRVWPGSSRPRLVRSTV